MYISNFFTLKNILNVDIIKTLKYKNIILCSYKITFKE